jgi:hypothetical protein
VLKMAGAVILFVPLSLLAIVAGTGVLVVDVREGGPSGHHIVLPVPLILAEAAARVAPHEKTSIDLGEAHEPLAHIEPLIRALEECPDGLLVQVEEPGQHVEISKVGPMLQVRVHDGGEEVAVDLPVAMVGDIVRHRQGDRIAIGDLVAALRSARLTKLVEVQKGDEHVRISVW